MKHILAALLLVVPLFGLTKASEELVKSMVPKGEVSMVVGRDYSIKTEAGTKVKVELERDGSLDEASGLNLGKGDIFEPGMGLISLGSAAQVVERQGHKVEGEWSLERDSDLGWVYELEGKRDDETMEYTVDAKKGQLIKAEN